MIRKELTLILFLILKCISAADYCDDCTQFVGELRDNCEWSCLIPVECQKCETDTCADHPNLCNPNTEVCVDTNDGAVCQCKPGYTKYNDVCRVQTCADLPPTYCGYKKCIDTYKGPECVVKTCADVGPNFCPYYQICVNGNNGPECQAKTCENSPNYCTKANEECVNTGSGPTCQCKSGYVRVNGNCEAKTCENSPNYCTKPNEECVNSGSGPSCQCKSGYERVNENCEAATGNKCGYTTCKYNEYCVTQYDICVACSKICSKYTGSRYNSCYKYYCGAYPTK